MLLENNVVCISRWRSSSKCGILCVVREQRGVYLKVEKFK